MSARTIILSASGAAGNGYWLARLAGGTDGSEFGEAIALDTDGNVYVAGNTNYQTAGNSGAYLAKYNNTGVLQWQKKLGGAQNEFWYDIKVDSSGNIYAVGTTDSQGSGQRDILVAKYNSSGTVQWQKLLGSSFIEYGYGVAVDGSGNVYVVGFVIYGSSYEGIVAKYNNSGVLQWQRSLGTSTTDTFFRAATLDLYGNLIVTGSHKSSVLLNRYSDTGNLSLQKLRGLFNNNAGYSVVVDSSGNIYVAGSGDASSALILKYDTNGSLQWQKTLNGSSFEYFSSVALDSAGNVYAAGSTNSQGSGGYDALIAKYDSSGNLQWQRVFGGSGNDYGNGIVCDAEDNVYVAGTIGGTYPDIFVLKIPNSGALTGTYGGLTYAASTLTEATSTISETGATLTDASSSLADATATLSESSGTLTSTIIPI